MFTQKFKLNPIACAFQLGKEVNGRVQLFPYGWFYPQDGCEGGWYVDDTNGYQLADDINNFQLMIDYEHQTLYVAENGKGNPAAGWMVKAEYISEQGIFVDVNWTSKAVDEIKNGIYKYLSPLFLADKSGRVIKVLNAALTNRPALHNLAEVVATSSQFSHYLELSEDNSKMKELLIKLFALSATATDAEIEAELTALSAAKGDSKVALKDVYGALKNAETEKVALSAKVNNPDPTQFVALSVFQATQSELNNLKQQVSDKERDALIQAALSDGRRSKAWAESLGKQNLVALSNF
ncbi:phage protease [Actinobacillus pleuropneumoniae]|uniref:phage protease n=1 Tax=Actinobacillus pleuropneumoniae TaxID=715 RepID=UPI001F34A4ED|nr:phage protease [Actinobacillus pleuropneumoniae]